MSQISAGHDNEASLIPKIESGFDTTVTKQPAPSNRGAGPVVNDRDYQQYLDALAADPRLTEQNTTLDPSVKNIGRTMAVAGAIAVAVTLLLGTPVHGLKHALASYMVGVFTVLACCLGSLFLVMITNALNSYWTTTLRRIPERIAGLIWLPILGMVPIVIIEIAMGGVLLEWLKPELQGTFLIEHKEGYLNAPFFVVRFIIYATIWLALARTILRNSTEQDSTGDRTITRRNRQISTFGLLVFALSVAFAAFDFLMSIDYRFFSTMWGVYYFAGAAMSGIGLTALTLAILRTFGKLTGVVTKEHFHDLGKLLFAFVVFWAYISFSQYFLIWYSNIPEETRWFVERQQGGWMTLFIILIAGHFIFPFLLLISRHVKKSTLGLGLFGAFLLVMQVLDMIYIIRPMVYAGAETNPGAVSWWLDILAPAGMLALLGGLLISGLASGRLVPVKDPRLGQCLRHKNYV